MKIENCVQISSSDDSLFHEEKRVLTGSMVRILCPIPYDLEILFQYISPMDKDKVDGYQCPIRMSLVILNLLMQSSSSIIIRDSPT